MKIDTSQIAAIRHRDGPMLVLAGPGSGKTLVLTRRVQYLVEQCHVPPEHILVITFTRAAAVQMRERFQRLMGGGRSIPVTFGTFHAVYFAILKHAYGYTAENIVTEEQRVNFIRTYIRRLRMECEDEGDLIRALLAEISLVKNISADLEHYYASCCGQDVFRCIFRAYEEFLRQNRRLDFDDMLVCCRELLEKRRDILAAWQDRFRYILIDEFQDINRLQYEIIRMLAAPQDNLFVVGDDDQSIYRFRGARPEIMLRFPEDYPGSRRTVLAVNYRSGSGIVCAAGRLIAHNRVRFSKNIAPSAKSGEPVCVARFADQRQQNLYVIREIVRLHREGVRYGDIAVLFRTNSQPRYLMEQMIGYNLPFLARDRIPDIYEHWIAKDLFTYMQIARGDHSRAAFLRIMNRPVRYLSRESLPGDPVSFAAWEDFYAGQDRMLRRQRKLRQDLDVLARMGPFAAINYIRRAIAYEDYLREYAAQRHIPEEDLLEVLEELQEHAAQFESLEEWIAHIGRLKEELRRCDRDAAADRIKDAVHLSTFHSAKGLEYDTVFLVDVNEGITPFRKAVLSEELEEERRMFYVGMTRARVRLYLLCSGKIHNKEMEPSRFIEEAMGEQRV